MVKIFTKMAAVGLVCFFFTVLTLSVLPKSPPDWVVLAVLIAVTASVLAMLVGTVGTIICYK